MATRPQHKLAYKRLCTLLRAMREHARLSQRALGAAMHLHHTMVHRSETGDRRIDPVEFADWCRACGVDAGDAMNRLARG